MTDFKDLTIKEQKYFKSLVEDPNLSLKLQREKSVQEDTLLHLNNDFSEYFIWSTIFDLNPQFEDIIVYRGARVFTSPGTTYPTGIDVQRFFRFFLYLDRIRVIIVEPNLSLELLRLFLDQALSVSPSISQTKLDNLFQETDRSLAQILSATLSDVGFTRRRLDLKIKFQNFTFQFYFFVAFSDALDLSIEQFKSNPSAAFSQPLSYTQLSHKTYEHGQMESDSYLALKFQQINLVNDQLGYYKTYQGDSPAFLTIDQCFDALMLLSVETNSKLLFSPLIKLTSLSTSQAWIEVYAELRLIILNFKNPDILNLTSRQEQQNWYLVRQNVDQKQNLSKVPFGQVPLATVTKIYWQKQASGKILIEARSLTETRSDHSKQQYTHPLSGPLLFSSFLVSVPRDALSVFKNWRCSEVDPITKSVLNPIDMDTLAIWTSNSQRSCFSKINLKNIISNVRDNTHFILPLSNGSSYRTRVYKTLDYLEDNNLFGFKIESWLNDKTQFSLIPIFSTWQNATKESTEIF